VRGLVIGRAPRYLALFATSASLLTSAEGAGRLPARVWPKDRNLTVARPSPTEFIRQVQTETKKVVWPTGRETMMTALMVILMTSVLGMFFFGLDSLFSAIVKQLLALLA